MQRVQNTATNTHLRRLFQGALLLFLVNIALGVLNVVTTGSLPRWQFLTHLHAGTIGWITLSLIGIAIWLFTGSRSVSETYSTRLGWLVWAGILVFGAYILGFAVALSAGGAALWMLPILGTAAMLVIWIAAAYAITQLATQPVVTTPHLLVVGGLFVAGVGATMGVLLGIEFNIGAFLPIEGVDRTGVHAGMMDAYIFIVAAAIVEWFITSSETTPWTRWGLAQTAAGTLAAILVPIAFLLNMVEALLPLFGVLLLVFLAIFLVRMGWRGLRTNPLGGGVGAWTFFGTAWLIGYVALFLWLVIGFQGDFTAAPTWFGVVFAHVAYIGMMTNLLFGVITAHTSRVNDVYAWAEPTALWTLNLGLIVFLALKIVQGIRDGALLMGAGVLLGVAVFFIRLRRQGTRETTVV